MFKDVAIGSTVYFPFAVNDTDGSGTDGSSPVAYARKAGAAQDAAPVDTATPTLLTDGTYPSGVYEIAFDVTVGNGFEVGEEYLVFFSLTADGQTPTGVAGSFVVRAAESTLYEVASTNLGSVTSALANIDTLITSALANIDTLINFAEADIVVDTTGDTYTLVAKIKDTDTVLSTKYLYQIGGSPVTAQTHVVGRTLESEL